MPSPMHYVIVEISHFFKISSFSKKKIQKGPRVPLRGCVRQTFLQKQRVFPVRAFFLNYQLHNVNVATVHECVLLLLFGNLTKLPILHISIQKITLIWGSIILNGEIKVTLRRQ